MQNHNEQEIRQYAGFWMRFAAYLIDGIIVMVALWVIEASIGPVTALLKDTPIGGEVIFQYTLMDIIEYILISAYFVLMTYFTGATLGKKILKLKVISAKEDGKLRLFDVIYRETIGRYLSDVFQGIGYLAVVFNDEKKAIHDMLCDTRVVEVRTKRVAPVRAVTSPGTARVDKAEASKAVVNMVPQMVEEPVSQAGSSVEEHVQEQWKQIFNSRAEENNSLCEEEKTEGNL